MPSLSGADLLALHRLSEFLIILGLVGIVAVFLDNRRIRKRLLGSLCAFLAVGGLVLAWRTEQLLVADRDLTPAQEAALSKAISRFPGIKFEVHMLRNDTEAQSLALKVVDAIKAGGGGTPQVVEAEPDLVPGVILVFAAKDVALHRDLSRAVGTELAAARIAVMTSDGEDQPERIVRIAVGKKP